MNTTLPNAEDINFWKSGTSSPDTWITKAIKQIENIDGEVIAHAFGSEPQIGRSAYMITFRVQENNFKLIWPVLPTKSEGNETSARRQAATMLYHDVKNKCINARIFGARTAFFAHLILPDGRVASDLSGVALVDLAPAMLTERTI